MELTADVREVILAGVEPLKSPAVRRFKAAIVRKLGRGGQRQAEQELGWNREAIRKGQHELRTGIECVDGRFSFFFFRARTRTRASSSPQPGPTGPPYIAGQSLIRSLCSIDTMRWRNSLPVWARP